MTSGDEHRDIETLVTCDAAVMGGEAVFAGTRIPVALVAAMLDRGAGEAELLDGYPALAHRHLEVARHWRRSDETTALSRPVVAGLTLVTEIRVPLEAENDHARS